MIMLTAFTALFGAIGVFAVLAIRRKRLKNRTFSQENYDQDYSDHHLLFNLPEKLEESDEYTELDAFS